MGFETFCVVALLVILIFVIFTFCLAARISRQIDWVRLNMNLPEDLRPSVPYNPRSQP